MPLLFIWAMTLECFLPIAGGKFVALYCTFQRDAHSV